MEVDIMSGPKLVMKPKSFLTELHSQITTDILSRLKNMYTQHKLPEGFDTIGIAQNVLLGVFQLVQRDYGYECYRIVPNKDGSITISDIGYPVTNIGTGDAPIECNIDYILSVRTLRLI